MGIIFSFFAKIYEGHLNAFNAIFTNSQNVHNRLLTYTRKESDIIYPPTDVEKFKMKDLQ